MRTDGGNLIYDAPCGTIAYPTVLAEALKSVTGVVDHGLFLGMADEAIIGTDEGVGAVGALRRCALWGKDIHFEYVYLGATHASL